MKKSKKLSHKILILIFAVATLTVSAQAQTNFSGTWKLIKNESELNSQFSFAPEKVVITHEGNNMQVVRDINMQGQVIPVDEKYTLDGKECENSGFQGSTKKSTANWSEDNSILTIKTLIEGGFGSMDTQQIYTMVGEKLKIESGFSSDQGDMNETWVLEKVE